MHIYSGNCKTRHPLQGFTLIELSIVLVIIGLIVGGILVGRDLISSAAVRGQIAQIEKINQAIHTFRGKYSYLPGDIPNPDAYRFGFKSRGSGAGQGDGDGFVNGAGGNGAIEAGEVLVFWVDLSTAKLIDGSFTTANPSDAAWNIANTNLTAFYPPGKLGSTYIYVYMGGFWNGSAWVMDGYNYLGLSAITLVAYEVYSNPGLTVAQAYAIDTKTDDGLPQSGKILAQYLDYSRSIYTTVWAGGTGTGNATASATSASATTCYDNKGVAGTQNYSIGQNNGSGMNCALSFKF